MTKTAVVALGGNALTLPGQAGRCDEMLANAAEMATAISEVMDAGWRVVVVHGNGPQVGSLALQQESATLVPAQPLAALNAMTQGQLGSLIALSFAGLSGDFVELHTNEEFARKSPFGRRIAHGALVFSISTGLMTQMNVINDTVLAFYGVDKLRFTARYSLEIPSM